MKRGTTYTHRKHHFINTLLFLFKKEHNIKNKHTKSLSVKKRWIKSSKNFSRHFLAERFSTALSLFNVLHTSLTACTPALLLTHGFLTGRGILDYMYSHSRTEISLLHWIKKLFHPQPPWVAQKYSSHKKDRHIWKMRDINEMHVHNCLSHRQYVDYHFHAVTQHWYWALYNVLMWQLVLDGS